MRELISNLLLVGSFLILSPIAFMHSSTAHAQNRLITLADARQELAVPAYTASERSLLAEQGLFTIENLFVHRELKIADFGQGHDPVPPLEDLVRDAATLDNRQFHNRITQIFTTLHDLHTNYIAPAPRSCGIPFIPLFLEGVLLGDEEVIVVSGKTQAGSELTEDVQRGMQLVSVNDRPVEQVLGELMLVSGGANAAAMRFRAIQLLTFRGSQVELPAEDQMKMKFLQEGLETEVTIPWLSMMLDSCLNENEDSESTEESLSLDIAMNMAQNEFQKEFNKVFDKNNLIKEKPPLTDIIVEEFQERFNEVYRHSNNESAEAPEAEAPEAAAPPAWSKVFTAEVLNTPAGKLGYINLKSFYWDDPNLDASTVVEAFRRTLEIGLVGVDSLVIDIRNNPGGLITFSEELVQLFAPQGVDPTTVRMLANPLNEKIFIKSNGSENRWSHAIRKAIDNGQKYMEPLAITPPTEANMMGQVWFKPVVVLTNAGCYSACDLFSAGMQDSGAATIIGVHSTTGAGGANVMEYSTFQQIMGNGVTTHS